ncbi:MAG: archaellin/type IV pilin N-terminal domain-containing protein [Candidatus Bathyarchaeia archaeon]
MAKGLVRNRKGISPVVATVILVAVTIVVAVAVSYWMGGIAGLYTRFEKVEITSAYATYDADLFTSGGWNVTVTLKNTGSSDATIDNILINGKPYTEYGANFAFVDPNGTEWGINKMPLASGSTDTLKFQLAKTASFTPGVNIEVRLHSAAGQEYPKTLTLP